MRQSDFWLAVCCVAWFIAMFFWFFVGVRINKKEKYAISRQRSEATEDR